MDRNSDDYRDNIRGIKKLPDINTKKDDDPFLVLNHLLLSSTNFPVLVIDRDTGKIEALNTLAKTKFNIDNNSSLPSVTDLVAEDKVKHITDVLASKTKHVSTAFHLDIKISSGQCKTERFSVFSLSPHNERKLICVGNAISTDTASPENGCFSNLLESLLETIPHPIFFRDTAGHFQRVNQNFSHEILGEPAKSLEGNELNKYIRSSLESFSELVRENDSVALKTSNPHSFRVDLKTPSGETKKYTVYETAYQNDADDIAGLVGIMIDSTELYNTTQRALEGEEKLKEIFENLNEIYFEVSLEGEILYVSPSAELITGYTESELIGTSMYDFYIRNEDRGRYLEALGETGTLKDYLVHFKDKPGNTRSFLVNSKLVKDKEKKPSRITGTMRDVTESYRYQEALKDSELKHRVLLENAGAQIIYTNNSGEIILINHMAAGYIGKKPASLIGKNVREIYKSLHGQVLLKHINEVLVNRKGTLVEANIENNGETFWFLINFQPVKDDQGNINGIVIISNEITDKKQSEKEMHKLSQAVEQSTALIQVFDTRGRIEYVNPRYTEVTGYAFEEVVGKYFFQISNSVNHPDNYHQIWIRVKQGEVSENEVYDRKKDGSGIWLKTILSPVTNSNDEIVNVIAVMEDITSRKEAEIKEKKIRENLLLLNETALKILASPQEESIFEIIGEQLGKIYPHSLFAINSYDASTRLLKTEYLHAGSDFLEKFLKITMFSLHGSVYKLSDSGYESLLRGELKPLEGRLNEMLFYRVPKNLCEKIEKLFNFDSFFSQGIAQNRNLYGNISIVTVRDSETIDRDLLNNLVTQASLGIERRKLEAELRSARDTAEEMNHIKSVFLANMSHELRTPLNGILGFSELLTENLETARFKEMAKVVNRSGVRLLETLNTILDFSMIESKNVVLNYSRENVVALTGEIAENYRHQAEKKGLSLEFSACRGSVEGFVVKNILEKIISQLLSNAVKFTNEGHIKVKVSCEKVKTQDFLHIEVVDTGQGIAKSALKHIFEEFRQGSEGFTRKFEGTGLGLTICRKFTTMLEGEISVNSTVGKGSSFTVSIPLYSNNPNEQS